METINVGIIGYGGFGQFLKNSWQTLSVVRIAAVADEVAGRNPGGDIRFYNRWQDLAKDELVDLVAIVTPPFTHAAIACGVMEAGKHVLIEKPMATRVSDARQVIKTRDRTGRVAAVDYMLRFNPIVSMLGQLTKEGALGQLRHVDVENYAQDEGLPPEHWFWNPEVSGGILIEHAVHFIDLVHSLTDQKRVSVTGLCRRRNDRQEDQVLACALYDEGLIATHYHSFARPGFFENTSIRFNYDLAQIDLNGWIPLSGSLTSLVSPKTRERIMELPGFQMSRCVGIQDARDESRPEGWGRTETAQAPPRRVTAGGIEYDVREILEGCFRIGKGKQEVYRDCVCEMLLDVIGKIRDPAHSLRVTLEDGLSSLEVAQLATEFARAGQSTDPI